jgi:hypothetical protein
VPIISCDHLAEARGSFVALGPIMQPLDIRKEHALETYKSLIQVSVEGMKLLALLNGGAAVALSLRTWATSHREVDRSSRHAFAYGVLPRRVGPERVGVPLQLLHAAPTLR